MKIERKRDCCVYLFSFQSEKADVSRLERGEGGGVGVHSINSPMIGRRAFVQQHFAVYIRRFGFSNHCKQVLTAVNVKSAMISKAD